MNEQNKATEKNQMNTWEISIIVIGILCGLCTWLFGFRPFLVNGLSMYPTFNTAFTDSNTIDIPFLRGDYLIIDIFSYRFHSDPERYDVIVFRSPVEPNRYLLKRVIGLPNEQVHLNGTEVTVTKINGDTMTLDEPYINQEEVITYRNRTVRLSDNQYFMLGDNRTNSLDSRVWGALPEENIVGRVALRLYPFDMAGKNPGAL